MPNYDYQCEKCEKQFEVFQSIKAEPLTDCPEPGCGGHVKRLLSGGAGLIFKGSGFYITDYRSEGYKKAAKADSASSSSSSPSTGSSSKPSTGGSDS